MASKGNRASRAFDALVSRAGADLLSFERTIERLEGQDVIIKRVSIKAPLEDGQDYFAIVTGCMGERPVVAFHGGSSFLEAVVGVARRLGNGSMTWKEDQYGEC